MINVHLHRSVHWRMQSVQGTQATTPPPVQLLSLPCRFGKSFAKRPHRNKAEQ